MTKNRYQNLIIIVLALAFGITACAGGTGETRKSGTRENLKKLKTDKEGELRQSWKDYTVYKRNRSSSSFQKGFVAFVFKLKDDKKMILDDQWIEVTSDEMKAKGKILTAPHLQKSWDTIRDYMAIWFIAQQILSPSEKLMSKPYS